MSINRIIKRMFTWHDKMRLSVQNFLFLLRDSYISQVREKNDFSS